MSETWPYFYEPPYSGCTQCGGSCYGKNCVRPGCDYIERASSNRWERPPVPGTLSSCIYNPHTCRTVGDLTYKRNEFVAPLSLPISNQCLTKTQGDSFQISRVKYARL